MTVYNINLGIGWASSGVEYAQAYRAQLLRNLQRDAKFVFVDMIQQENIAHLTENIGFLDSEVIWLYTYFTDTKIAPTSVTLADVLQQFHGQVTKKEKNGKIARYYYAEEDFFLTAYLVNENDDFVNRVEYVSKGNLIRKDFFSYTKLFTEFYGPKDNRAMLYKRHFYNEDGTVAYEEIIQDGKSLFRFPDQIFYSKEELLAYFVQQLNLGEDDTIILDRSSGGVGQAVFRYHGKAKLGVVVHAEHFSEGATTKDTILWNNYYDYQFTNADEVDFFVTATDRQRDVLLSHFKTYRMMEPKIVTIPVGSLQRLIVPNQPRTPYSLLTASRLASEKHINWLIKSVVKAKEHLPELVFDIYGSGGEEKILRQLIAEYQATSYIHLKGHHQMDQVYQQYELYLTASTSEGFGLTLMEAVGSGLPIIGFDVNYGNPTFIKDCQNGYLIPRQDNLEESAIVQSFADRIIEFFDENDIENMHEKSYEIAEQYLTAVIEKKWDELLKGFGQ